jgi:hypothetical protein
MVRSVSKKLFAVLNVERPTGSGAEQATDHGEAEVSSVGKAAEMGEAAARTR